MKDPGKRVPDASKASAAEPHGPRVLYLESLGCAKNLVDSEVMLGEFLETGWTVSDDPSEADVIIVNTCSFIESAADESIDRILELAKFKLNGVCDRLIVTGCLPERFGDEIADALPEVDIFLGTGAFDQAIEAALGSPGMSRCVLPDPSLSRLQASRTPRALSSPHSAYLKIAEGCSRHCTYCIIPKLRGRQKSRPIEDLVAEARSLIGSGVKELVLVAHDTTGYGRDLGPTHTLARLLERIASLSQNVWLRMLYGHPESIDEPTIRTIAAHPQVCPYFDIPIQHAEDGILRKMGRNYSQDDLAGLFDTIRSLVPDAAFRTSVIVGFPGEKEVHFEALLDFVGRICFDHLGVFLYSGSHDLSSDKLADHVPPELAQERYDRLMSSQRTLSRGNIRKYRGTIQRVLLEGQTEANRFVGRTAFQAPEVDGVTTIVSDTGSKCLSVGDFADVRITSTLDYDLLGEPVWTA